MENNHILIKKGLQKDVLYKGLKANYISYCLYLGLAAILTGLFLSTFIPMILAMAIIVVAVTAVFLVLLFYSSTYGANGFVKKMADARKPGSIKVSNSFENLLIWKNS